MSTATTWDELQLTAGSHGAEWCGEQCAVELANLIAARLVAVPPDLAPVCPLEPAPFADDHPSISRVIRAYVVAFNDAWDDEQRQALKPYAARILGTATRPADEETRAWMAIDWLVRVHTPALLRLTGLEDHARALEALAQIADPPSAREALVAIGEAHKAAFPDATRGFANDAARIAAWVKAGDAARIAAWVADAPWYAWRAASWAAFRSRGTLRVVGLQDSALELLDAMIAVGRTS